METYLKGGGLEGSVRELQRHQLFFNFLKHPGTNNQTICKHLRENKEISDSQYGFVQNKSCQTNLISLHDRVTGSETEEKQFNSQVLTLVRLLRGHSHKQANDMW